MILKIYATPVLGLPRWAKRSIVLVVDTALCVLTVWLAYYLRLGEFVALSGAAFLAAIASIGVALPIFAVSGLYRAIFRYSGWPALLTVTRAITVYFLVYASLFTAIGIQDVPRTIGIIQPILLLMFVGGSRAMARVWLGEQYQNILKRGSRPKVLVYGAGRAGRQLVAALADSPEMQVVGFLDDDYRLHARVLNGKMVYDPADLVDLVSSLSIQKVLLAMPRLGFKRRNEILKEIQMARVDVRTLPSMVGLAEGKISVSDLRDLDIEDLLGRELVMPNFILMTKTVRNKVVMVTGAGGSIGSELCRQIFSVCPRKLLLIDQSEFALYSIHQELEEKPADREITLVPLLASVQDSERMMEIMSTWHPDTIYHAAAYKHVPLVEHNPAEGIKNNVLGTLRTARAAAENGVSNFVLVSTDKAVRPTNIMGASKRLAEIVLQALATTASGTKFSIVRFGNVLGSSGSVVPKFRQQVRSGGPITLTHRDVTRYFMSIPEAAQLVIQAGAMAKGGDIFVLDMGPSIRIIDMARRIIELSGLTVKDAHNPDGDIEIEITGLRPGEKLYEELLIGNNPEPTSHPRILKAHETFLPWVDLEDPLKALEMTLNLSDTSAIFQIMEKIVEGFVPSDTIVDWIFMEQEAEAKVLGLAR
jgi:FlaA1/EpsC-like NDP-sugar epimerase